MTKTFEITANAIEPSRYEAADEAGAILAYVRDAGYRTVDDAAEACGQSVEDFLADIRVEEVQE